MDKILNKNTRQKLEEPKKPQNLKEKIEKKTY